MKLFNRIILIGIVAILASCSSETPEKEKNGIPKTKWVKMLVEIPAGTVEKFELNKKTNKIERDSIDGKPRTINYLGYPGNYGMIPNTMLPYEFGGDGDPLDIISIGPSVHKGKMIESKIIGVLKLKDKGEQDDKLIAISKNSSLKNINSLKELNKQYPGITTIIETWFINYKGKNKVISEGFKGNRSANRILVQAKKAYKGE